MADPRAARAAVVQPSDADAAAAALLLVPPVDGLFEFLLVRRLRRARHFRRCLRGRSFRLGGAALAVFCRQFDAWLLRPRLSARLPDLPAVPRPSALLRD